MTTHVVIDPVKLAHHMKLCIDHLRKGNEFCAHCPFEAIILDAYPEHEELFDKVKKKHYKLKRKDN